METRHNRRVAPGVRCGYVITIVLNAVRSIYVMRFGFYYSAILSTGFTSSEFQFGE